MKRKLMLLLACLFVGISLVTAQTQKVTGVVISEEDGQPVVGASVLVKGTTQGTITDIDGNFNLANVPSSAKTLQISYIGMQTQEVAIKPMVKVTLKSDAQNLDEVIVVAYGTAKKSSFTGSAAVIKADKIVSGSKDLLTRHCPVKWQVCAQPQQLVTQDLWPKSTFAVSVLSVLLKARCMLLTVL